MFSLPHWPRGMHAQLFESNTHYILRMQSDFRLRYLQLPYFDFFSCLAFLFSMMDFAGFFLTSFLASLDFAIIYLLCASL